MRIFVRPLPRVETTATITKPGRRRIVQSPVTCAQVRY